MRFGRRRARERERLDDNGREAAVGRFVRGRLGVFVVSLGIGGTALKVVVFVLAALAGDFV